MRGRLLLLGITVLSLAAASEVSAQKKGGILRITHRDSPASMSIHEEGTISTVMPIMSMFNNLIVFDPKERQNSLDKLEPDVATSWTWSDDGKSLTFTLRIHCMWH